MIPRCRFDRGSRITVWLGGKVRSGTVQSAHEWIDKKTGEHMRRRIVQLDSGIDAADSGRWNFALSELMPPFPTSEKQP